MSEIQVRPMIAGDLPRLMGMDHSMTSEYVWQLELRREGAQTRSHVPGSPSAAAHPASLS